jgi:hypothetical protein
MATMYAAILTKRNIKIAKENQEEKQPKPEEQNASSK